MYQMLMTKWRAIGVAVALGLTPVTFGADQQPAGSTAPPSRPPAGQRGGPGMPGQRDEQLLKQMVEQLKLTDDQKKKVETNLKTQTEAMRKLREDTSLTAEQRREKARALREENDTKLKGILSQEQFEKWQKFRQEQGQALRERRGTGQGQGQGGGQRRGQGQTQGQGASPE